MINAEMLPLDSENDNNKLDIEWNKGQQSSDDAYDTKVKKYTFAKLFVVILIVSLLIACTLLIIIITRRISENPLSNNNYYINGTVYEILTESFQDSSPKSENGIRSGDGVGDIKGIRRRLNYIKNVVKSNTLYINSMYESNDDDHMTVVDQRKIAPVFGTMDDFDMLLKVTQNMSIAVIMDFIPNHTGRRSEWFLKSQKKEGKYSDYYIWARCNPSKGIYPNEWMKMTGGSAWSYDNTRKECFYHQLAEDKPDLNLWNPDVRQELENILRFWLDKGVDGFHVHNVQYLYEDQDLNKGNYRLFDKIGKENHTFEYNQTWNHPENTKILQAWKAVLDTYEEEKVLYITEEYETLNTSWRYIEAGVTAVRVNPLSSDRASMAERIENKLKEANFSRVGWMFNDKYSSRLARPKLTNALLTLQATLPGVLFNYYGNEIGMTDHPTLPSPFKYRTPMQWNPDGTGFSKNSPWLPQNPNYTTVNVEMEEAVAFTPLTVFKRLQTLRAKESLKTGEMKVFRNGDLLMFTRKAGGFPGYLVAINFGNKRMTESFYEVTGIPQQVKVVFHSHKHDNTIFDLSRNSYILDPNHAVVLEYE